MKRIMIIGSGGSGKSTLALRLGEILRLPVHHLDRLFWQPGWIETPKEEWAAIQQRLCAEPEWILDGNYGGTMDLRLAACDTVIFLVLSRWHCLWQALKRRIVYHNRVRPDMTAGCPERINRDFLRWIWNYPHQRRPGILRKLASLPVEKTVIVLRSTREVRDFLERLRAARASTTPAPATP